MNFRLTRLALPAACVLAVLAGPAFAQSMAPAPGGTMAPSTSSTSTMAPTAAKPAAVAPTTASNAPTAPAKMSKNNKSKLPNSDKFTSAAAASTSCPGDTVVWSTMSKSRSFHLASSKYYGKTKHGAYVCEKTAVSAGFHQAKT